MVEGNVSLVRCIVDVSLWMKRLGLPLRRAVHTAHKPLSSVRPSVRPSCTHRIRHSEDRQHGNQVRGGTRTDGAVYKQFKAELNRIA